MIFSQCYISVLFIINHGGNAEFLQGDLNVMTPLEIHKNYIAHIKLFYYPRCRSNADSTGTFISAHPYLPILATATQLSHFILTVDFIKFVIFIFLYSITINYFGCHYQNNHKKFNDIIFKTY